MLPKETYARILTEGQILGLKMVPSGSEQRIFHFRIETVEGPNDLMEHSIGAAAAQDTDGTGWNTIVNSASNRLLEPESERIIYHVFMGVSPGQARVYRNYPSAQAINSLYGTRSVGDAIGFIDGRKSPYDSPSPTTEMFIPEGVYPEFNGYHPFLEPPTITVRLAFYITRYDITFMGVDPSGGAEDRKRNIALPEVRERAKVRTMGGHRLVSAPRWILAEMRRG